MEHMLGKIFTLSLDAITGDAGTRTRDFELVGVLGNSAPYNKL